jgi:hypothetical protein
MPKAQCPCGHFTTVEQRLSSPSESDPSPVFQDLIMEIRLNPRSSVLARLGLTSIDKEWSLSAKHLWDHDAVQASCS